MTDYAWAATHDVADNALVTVETDLTPYMGSVPFVMRSQPLNRYPVRTVLASGRERGDGRLDHVWTITRLTREAMNYIEDTYLNGAVSAAVTIRTRLHDQDTWARYNAYLALYLPKDDGEYELGEFIDVQVRFRNLVAL